jgi:hypothetical protein
VLATRSRATSLPEGSSWSSTSLVRLPDSAAVAMSRIGTSVVAVGVSCRPPART